MLIIRKEQMDIFGRYMLKQFEDRMVLHLRSAFPKQTKDKPEPDLRLIIQLGIEKAASYDVEGEDDVQRYLGYMVIYGPDFDRNRQTSWAGDILRIENLHGKLKMDRIDERHGLLMKGQA